MADNAKLVTDELVAQVAEKLTAAGEKVSNRAVWSAIGGGSMTTISAALRRWRERQELQPAQHIERAPLPEDVRAVLAEAGDLLWAAAQRETQRELDDLTASMNERISAAHAERDEALAELESTAEELQQAQATIAEQAQAVAAALVETQQLSADVEQLRQALATQTEAAHTAAAALAEAQRHADRLATVLDRERTERAVAAERAAEAESRVAALSAQEAAQRDRADDLARRLELAEQRAQEAQQEAKSAARDANMQRLTAEATQARLEAAARDLTAAREALTAAKADTRKAQDEAAELRGRLAAQLATDDEQAGTAAKKPLK